MRATTPPRLPVVLTRAEVSAVLAELNGTRNLLVALLEADGWFQVRQKAATSSFTTRPSRAL